MKYPELFRIRQKFDVPTIDDVEAEVALQLDALDLQNKMTPGQSVAVTAGSRGIADIATITRAVIDHFKSIDVHPFIIPAMGSHGGGTAEGQLHVLEKYGITESAMGCPIRSSMKTIELFRTEADIPIYIDRHAADADHIFICNRVKPHTRFAGPVESGLLKMMMIGLGKADGALAFHGALKDRDFPAFAVEVGRRIIDRCPIIGALAIVENAFDRVALLEAVPPERIVEREPALLRLAKRWMARLPFDDVDLLIIDRIGKNISGTGLDSNIVGRKFDDHKATGDERPRIEIIAVRSLTPETNGNANGMGMAELCRSSMLREIDFAATRFNAMTANHVSAAMTPLDFETDREIIDAAMRSIGRTDAKDARILWIADTLDLSEIECSSAYWETAQRRDDLEIIAPPRPIPLDANGNLPESVGQLH